MTLGAGKGTAGMQNKKNPLFERRSSAGAKSAGIIKNKAPGTKRKFKKRLSSSSAIQQAEAKSLEKYHGSRVVARNIDKASPEKTLRDGIVNDIVKALRPKQDGSKQQEVGVLNARKKYWMRHANLPSEKFKEIWQSAQEKARKRLVSSSAGTNEAPLPSSSSKKKSSALRDTRTTTGGSWDWAPDASHARDAETDFDAAVARRASSSAKESAGPAVTSTTAIMNHQGQSIAKRRQSSLLSDNKKRRSFQAAVGRDDSTTTNTTTAASGEGYESKKNTKRAATATRMDTIDTTPTAKKPKDWSFLVAGKNYDLERLDMETWDTYEEISPVRLSL